MTDLEQELNERELIAMENSQYGNDTVAMENAQYGNRSDLYHRGDYQYHSQYGDDLELYHNVHDNDYSK